MYGDAHGHGIWREGMMLGFHPYDLLFPFFSSWKRLVKTVPLDLECAEYPVVFSWTKWMLKWKRSKTFLNKNCHHSSFQGGGDGGDGFFLACEGWQGKVWWVIPCLRFLKKKVEINLREPIPLCGPGSVHSGSASWEDNGRSLSDESCVSLFPWLVPTLCLDSIVSPLRLRWVKGVLLYNDDLPPALAVTRGWNGHRKTVSTDS